MQERKDTRKRRSVSAGKGRQLKTARRRAATKKQYMSYKEKARGAKDRAVEGYHRYKEKVSQKEHDAERYIKKNPMRSVAAAAAAGAVVGASVYAARKRRKSKRATQASAS